jgi:organic radical activating enzyme
MKKYLINEIFYSIQGEGVRAGTANVFVRFSKCNLQCNVKEHGFDCDTDFSKSKPMTSREIIDECKKIGENCNWIVFTGGEPALQLDDNLIKEVKLMGYSIAIETNGTIKLPEGIDWICVSPKTENIKVDVANEVKFVINWKSSLPKTNIIADYYLLSPAHINKCILPSAIDLCIKLCKKNPQWRVSTQQHKLWGIR